MKRLFTLATISLILVTIPVSAKDTLESKKLEKSLAVAIVRNSLIQKGLNQCQIKNHHQTINLLKTFLNRYKVSATPLEKQAYSCLALAYQNTGELVAATETIERTLRLFKNTPSEQAELEYTAGIIAYRQNKKLLAIKHWKKARQLYLKNNAARKWLKTSFNLAVGYQKLGLVNKQRQLWLELKNYRNKFADI